MTDNDTHNRAELPLLEEHTLQQIAGDLSADILADLLGSFVDDLESRLGAIEQARAQGDVATLAEQAHALKSSTGSYGARRLQEHCRELEQLARGGHSGSALKAAATVVECGNETMRRYTDRAQGS